MSEEATRELRSTQVRLIERRAVVATVLLLGMLVGCARITPGGSREASAPVIPPDGIVDADLAADGTGWALSAAHELFVSNDAGSTWRRLSPPFEPASVATSGDDVLVSAIDGPDIQVGVSHDGGASWDTTRYPSRGQPGRVAVAIRRAAMAILVQETSSSNFSIGKVLVSSGSSDWKWHDAPAAGKFGLVAKDELWIAGGASGGELWRSSDLGTTWERSNLPDYADVSIGVGIPKATSDQDRSVVITLDGTVTRAVVVRSKDSGATWIAGPAGRIDGSTGPGVSLPASMTAGNAWLLISADGSSVYEYDLDSETVSPVPATGLSEGVAAAFFATRETGWALVANPSCQFFKSDCQVAEQLFVTTDGGRTWNVLHPGLSAAS